MNSENLQRARSSDLFKVALAYLLAFLAAIITAVLLESEPLILKYFIADLAGTVVVFLFSIYYNNSSFYDPYWSLAPVVIACFLAFSHAIPDLDLRAWLIVFLVAIYGFRLTWNWMRGWPGLHHQDWRYVDLQEQSGPMYWWVSFGGIHLFPTVLVFLGCVPLFFALSGNGSAFGILDVLAAIVTFTGIMLEGIADNQLRKFRLSKPESGAILNTGLWKYSRHPNYLGEMTFWWGLFLFGLAAYPGAWYWMIPGSLAITMLFLLFSIPKLDERSLSRRPGYEEHMKKTPALFPWFPKS